MVSFPRNGRTVGGGHGRCYQPELGAEGGGEEGLFRKHDRVYRKASPKIELEKGDIIKYETWKVWNRERSYKRVRQNGTDLSRWE